MWLSVRWLSETRFFGRHIAPFFYHRFLHLPGVGSRPGAHLLRNIYTLLSRLQLGHQLGDMFTGPLGFQRALFLGGVLHHSLYLVVTLLGSLFKATTSRSTEFPGLLGTASDGSVLLNWLLGHSTHLFGPLGTLCVGGVPGCFILTLLFNLSSTLDNIVLDFMN